jgi:hypothetical protein
MERKMLPITFLENGASVESETTFSWSSPYVFCVHTTIDPAGLALSVHSTYTGHPELPTLARHLLLGPVGQPARYHEDPPAQGSEDGLRARVCVYEHCQQMLELLQAHGLQFRCQIADRDLTLHTAR